MNLTSSGGGLELFIIRIINAPRKNFPARGPSRPCSSRGSLRRLMSLPWRSLTKYTGRVLRWTVDDRESHEKMGFHQGWGQATDQLEARVAVC